MRPRLGLVCITDDHTVRYRTITRKRFLALEEEGSGVLITYLYVLYADNLERLHRAITFCAERNIRLYRVTSHLFPFSDQPVGREVLITLADHLREAGKRLDTYGIRLVVHPDQFVVLNSDRPEVIENSISILEHNAFIFDLLQLPRTVWATIIVHGGKGNRADRLIEVTRRLSEAVVRRLAFENDERSYSATEILDVCRNTGIPMVFDAHHHVVREKLEDFEHPSIRYFLDAARETWSVPDWQIVHISNGRGYVTDPRHSDLIHTMPSAFRNAPWIEVEAKRKDVAIEKLREKWMPDYDNS